LERPNDGPAHEVGAFVAASRGDLLELDCGSIIQLNEDLSHEIDYMI
jgi:hypothetical protein